MTAAADPFGMPAVRGHELRSALATLAPHDRVHDDAKDRRTAPGTGSDPATGDHRPGSFEPASGCGVLASLDAARATVVDAVARLAEANVPDEAHARYLPESRLLGIIPRRARFEPLGRVWRLGVLLVDRDANVYAVGTTTRAVKPGHRQHQSVSAEERKAVRLAAYNGPFEEGEVVDFDTTPVSLDSEAPAPLCAPAAAPLYLHDDALLVRWRPDAPDAEGMPFSVYVAEQLDLAILRTGL